MAIIKLNVSIKKPVINCSIQKKEIKCTFREVLFTYNEDYEVDFLANHLEGAGNIKITEDEQNKKVIIDDTHDHDSQYLKKDEKAVDSFKLDGKDSSYYTTAQNITYDNSTSGLSSTNVQDAIDELDDALDNLSTDAKDINYDNSTSGLSATNVQDALDEIDNNVDSLESDVSNLNNEVSGLNNDVGNLSNEVSNLSDEFDAHKADTNNPHNVVASQVSYDNTTSGLSAGNVQSAIDEVVSDLISHINDQNNPHNVTASQIGGQNILNELLNVDGSGSGLDADLLDGFHADTNPAPNTIIPLNNVGILDLSETSAKINAYTIRRVDLTDAEEDYFLEVGEEAYIEFTNTTEVPLHIATSSGSYYELDLLPTNEGSQSGGGVAPIFLKPNNTTYSNAFKFAQMFRNRDTHSSSYETFSAFRIGFNWAHIRCYIWNTTQYKSIISLNNLYGGDPDYPGLVIASTNWRNTTTPWTSLGTITFPQLSSGKILIRRIL
ncbi:MAG: hypothetical protein DRH57_00265 [Candidatus Cloacimonadota bacterium]|nr:MAG: hypothetical protein DRH57_00265 [Candidatus Cloacimonadota bacterium]